MGGEALRKPKSQLFARQDAESRQCVKACLLSIS